MTKLEDKPSARYPCPACGDELVWDSANPWRPFCSKRCSEEDFLAWSEERHSIAGQPANDLWPQGDNGDSRED